jgi:hypothetical protein
LLGGDKKRRGLSPDKRRREDKRKEKDELYAAVKEWYGIG